MTRLEPDGYEEMLSLFSPDTHKALALIAEQPDRLRVEWPSPGFARWMESEGQTDALPAQRSHREFRAALFGEHAYRLAPTLDTVRTVTGTQLQRWLQHTRRPNNGALVIVGDVDIDDVSRSAEELLRNWKGNGTPVPAPPSPPPARPRRRARQAAAPVHAGRAPPVDGGALRLLVAADQDVRSRPQVRGAGGAVP